MLVKKGETLIRPNGDDTATPYEVLLADDELFCVGEICYDEEAEEYYPSFVCTEVYTNDEHISDLKELGFVRANKEG